MPDRTLRLQTRPWVRSRQDAGATKWLPRGMNRISTRLSFLPIRH